MVEEVNLEKNENGKNLFIFMTVISKVFRCSREI